jgi:hypothetical protein
MLLEMISQRGTRGPLGLAAFCPDRDRRKSHWMPGSMRAPTAAAMIWTMAFKTASSEMAASMCLGMLLIENIGAQVALI